MINKTTIALVHLVPAGMLVLAIGRWPYGYYMLLRVVVFAMALVAAAVVYQRTKQFMVWISLFLVIALVFNPFVPLHLTRGVWSVLNLATAGLFIGHFLIARPYLAESQ